MGPPRAERFALPTRRVALRARPLPLLAWRCFAAGLVLGLTLGAPRGTAAREASPAQRGQAPGSSIRDRMRGRELAADLPPLDHPECRPAASASHMREEDPVLGVVVAGRARAYPAWIVKNYHVVNDTLAGIPIVVAFCEQCSGGAAFSRRSQGTTLSIDVAGVYNGTILLKDRETGTLWAPFSGRALEGPLSGRRLERFPLSFVHWDEWSARHPETDVVFATPSARAGHGSWYTIGKWGIVSEMGGTIEAWDPRLPENTLVYGVASGTSAKAYPLASVGAHEGVVNDRVGGTAVVVLARGTLEAAGFERTLKGRLLSFHAASAGTGIMVDTETGTSWSEEGVALRGPLQGERLQPLDGYSVEWHVWAAYNPRAELFEPPGAAPSLADRELAFPELTLRGLGEDGPRLLGFRDGVNLVALFSTWCPPCRGEMSRIEELVRRHAARGLTAVGIAIHIPEAIERQAVKSFVTREGITFPVLLVDDPAYEQLDALARSAGGPGLVLPTVFVVDRRGRVLTVLRGNQVAALPDVVDRLLGPDGS